ncbi:hypothetical protein AAVH_42089, partial [Aphelenchoides avenae]
GYLGMLAEREYISDSDKSFGRFNLYETWNRTISIFIAIITAFVASQAFFICCGLWITRSVGVQLANASKRTRQMHLQFTRLLLLQ